MAAIAVNRAPAAIFPPSRRAWRAIGRSCCGRCAARAARHLLGIIYSGVATPTEAARSPPPTRCSLALVTARWESCGSTRSCRIRSADRGDRAHHVRRLRLQLRRRQRERAALLRNTLIGWHLPPAAFLLCVNLLLLLLAVAIDEITILLVIVPLLVPVAAGLGIDLVHFGIVVMLNMMVGLALPPHGLLLFVISGLTGTSVGAIFREVPPFILTLVGVLLIATFAPGIVLRSGERRDHPAMPNSRGSHSTMPGANVAISSTRRASG